MAINRKGKAVLFAVLLAYALFMIFAIKSKGEEVANGSDAWQVNIIARTIRAEANDQGSNGLYAVACVIQQRSIERKITGAEVCLQRLQFSCWNKANAKDKQFRPLKKTWQAEYAKLLAESIVAGQNLQRDFVGNANHYHAKSVTPKWSRGEKPVAVIGDHMFFKL